MLETTLDSFLTPSLSFFVPRETIQDLLGEDYCLWNGLIGAAPGHPFIAKAVERIMRAVSSRADYFDFEVETCRAVGPSAAVWKLRSLPTLIVSGPCALGMAVNEALGKKDFMSKFDPGWLLPSNEQSLDELGIGDVLILLSDKLDTGSFRFSDVARNLIVASTDMLGLSKQPLLDNSLRRAQARSHYSETEFMSDIYGEKGVYKDSLVTNEDVAIQLIHIDDSQ